MKRSVEFSFLIIVRLFSSYRVSVCPVVVLPSSCVPVFMSLLCVCFTVKPSGFSLAGFLFISVVMKLMGRMFLQFNNKHYRRE